MSADTGGSGAGIGLCSDIGTDKATGTGGSDGASPWSEARVGGFGVPSVFAAPKKEC